MISILMPAYNAEEYIENSINSILKQTYTNFELLICDDCSTDNTWEKIGLFNDSRIKTYRNSENLGYLKTSNLLLSKSKGSYISFQDADDYSLSTRLDLLVSYLTAHDLDLVGSYCATFVKDNQPLSIIKYPTDNDDIYNDILTKPYPPFCGSAILTTRKVITECGLYDEKFDRIGAEDYDWLYRVSLNNFRMGNISESLYYYRQHYTGVSKTNFKKNILAMYSVNIAKDLYLARLNNHVDINFECLSLKYLENEAINNENLLYTELDIKLLGERKRIPKELYSFLVKSSFSKRKIKMTILGFSTLLLGYKRTERVKNIFRN